MAKKFSAPLERTARLLDLVPYINSHQGISLDDLAQTFEVSNAQMISDLTTLWMCGLPGYTPLELMDLDFESGFVTISNAQTLSQPRSITFDEAIALLLGLDLLRSSISDGRDDLIEQIDSLSRRLSEKTGLPRTLTVLPAVRPSISGAISDAINLQSGLKITYHSLYRDEVTDRTIFPIEIIHNEAHQYLSAYCYAANDFRQFRIDRITWAQPVRVEKKFESIGKEPSKIAFSLSVKAATREVSERFNQSQLSPISQFQGSSYSVQWIERSVLASGGAVELISPHEIRTSVAAMAQSMLDRYKGK